MEYPIKDDRLVKECKEYFKSKGWEFNQSDEEDMRSFTYMLNQAYAAGVQDGIKRPKEE